MIDNLLIFQLRIEEHVHNRYMTEKQQELQQSVTGITSHC